MKLEDIPKKKIYEVPDGYFDTLPGIIQSRIAAENKTSVSTPYFRFAFRYALPLVVLGVILFVVFQNNTPKSPEDLLAKVSTEELTFYLVESDLSTEELLDNINLDDVNIHELNEAILPYSNFDSDVLEEFSNELPI